MHFIGTLRARTTNSFRICTIFLRAPCFSISSKLWHSVCALSIRLEDCAVVIDILQIGLRRTHTHTRSRKLNADWDTPRMTCDIRFFYAHAQTLTLESIRPVALFFSNFYFVYNFFPIVFGYVFISIRNLPRAFVSFIRFTLFCCSFFLQIFYSLCHVFHFNWRLHLPSWSDVHVWSMFWFFSCTE